MTNDKTEKCAHIPCSCVPPKGEKYCSQLCKDAGPDETEIGCVRSQSRDRHSRGNV